MVKNKWNREDSISEASECKLKHKYLQIPIKTSRDGPFSHRKHPWELLALWCNYVPKAKAAKTTITTDTILWNSLNFCQQPCKSQLQINKCVCFFAYRRKTIWIIENSMNIYFWGGVKVVCNWNVNDICRSIHPISKVGNTSASSANRKQLQLNSNEISGTSS